MKHLFVTVLIVGLMFVAADTLLTAQSGLGPVPTSRDTRTDYIAVHETGSTSSILSGGEDPVIKQISTVFGHTVSRCNAASGVSANLTDEEVKCDRDTQWCCKHDFSKPGNPCIKCCAK
jgi:hypothetical protein